MKARKYISQMGFVGGFILDFVQSIVLALAVFVLFYLFVVQPNEVQGSSMLPNFVDGEYLLTEKVTYYLREPERGDVIVFKAPSTESCAAEGCEYIKRIIAVPGDTVMVKNGRVYLNGVELEEDFLADGTVTEAGQFLEEGVEITVPDGDYFCMGDNREHSRDCREFGYVSEDLIVGMAFFKYWPISSVGLVSEVSF